MYACMNHDACIYIWCMLHAHMMYGTCTGMFDVWYVNVCMYDICCMYEWMYDVYMHVCMHACITDKYLVFYQLAFRLNGMTPVMSQLHVYSACTQDVKRLNPQVGGGGTLR